MANRTFNPIRGSIQKEMVILTGSITIGATGAISTNVTRKKTGFNVAKTAAETGRYTITLDDKYPAFLGGFATIIGPDDAAMTAGGGLVAVFRDNDVASDGTIEVQFVRPDTYVDADVQSGAVVTFVLFFANTDV